MLIQQAPYISTDEIESLTASELFKADLLPSTENPIVDIESFIERHLGAQLEQYCDLAPDVLGLTYFHANRPPHILINRNLAEAADDVHAPTWYRGRLRSTMAHEAGHVLLHRKLFDFSSRQDSLWPETEASESEAHCQRCLKRDSSGTKAGRVDRREYQANIAMAALLMPKQLFLALASTTLSSWDIIDSVPKSQQKVLTERLTRELAERFQVSRQACEIRMQTLDINLVFSQSRLIPR